jgi:serine/threonine protein phosphatase PrpC
MPEYDDSADTMEYPALAKKWSKTASSLVNVDFGACSHQGKVRLNNEDSFLVARLERSLQTLLTNLPAGDVPEHDTEVGYGMLVADGMGGAAAGEIASRSAISTLVELVLQTPDWHMHLDNKGVNKVLVRLDQRFGKLREALIERARREPGLAGMGTTMTVAVSHGANLLIAHIGDSRAYLFHDGQLHLLTRDQTVAQTLAEVGIIRQEEVAKHPGRHVLTGVIATQGEEAQAEFHQAWLADGDQVMLCTDGLTEMVGDAAIIAVLEKAGPASHACQALVDLALEAGGRDNVTVILGRYAIPEENQKGKSKDESHVN